MGGSHAGVEIMLLTIISGTRFVEVPVNYLPRVGESSVTGKPLAATRVGLRMIGLILRFRRRPAAGSGRAPAFRSPRGPRRGLRAHEQLPLRHDRGGLRRVAAASRRRALPAQADQVRASSTARAGRASTSAAAPGCSPSRLAERATRWPASTPPRGCSTCCARGRPRRGGPGLGHRASVRGRQLRPRADRGGDAPHRRPDGTCGGRWPRWSGWTRPGGRVLVWDHNPRNPYWGRLMARVPQDTGEERLIPEAGGGRRAAGRRCRASCSATSSGSCPTSRRRVAGRGRWGGAGRRASAGTAAALRP